MEVPKSLQGHLRGLSHRELPSGQSEKDQCMTAGLVFPRA